MAKRRCDKRRLLALCRAMTRRRRCRSLSSGICQPRLLIPASCIDSIKSRTKVQLPMFFGSSWHHTTVASGQRQRLSRLVGERIELLQTQDFGIPFFTRITLCSQIVQTLPPHITRRLALPDLRCMLIQKAMEGVPGPISASLEIQAHAEQRFSCDYQWLAATSQLTTNMWKLLRVVIHHLHIIPAQLKILFQTR